MAAKISRYTVYDIWRKEQMTVLWDSCQTRVVERKNPVIIIGITFISVLRNRKGEEQI